MIVLLIMFFGPIILGIILLFTKDKKPTNYTVSRKEEEKKNTSNTSSIASVTNNVSTNTSNNISVIPNRISVPSPKLRLSVVDGEYRLFENYYIDGEEYTFGFPKDNCRDKSVWVGIGAKEVDRISYNEAMRRIGRLSSGYQNSLQSNNSWQNRSAPIVNIENLDDSGNDLPF